MQRRKFLTTTARAGLGLSALGLTACGSQTGSTTEAEAMATPAGESDLWFDISLAQWSLNKAFFGGDLDTLDFAKVARETYGVGGIEYVSQFFRDKAEDRPFLTDLKQRADDHDVRSLLIMIDGQGNLGATDEAERMTAVDNHKKWVEAAKFLGCHSIRVNAAGQGTEEEVAAAATDGLRTLSEFAKPMGMNVIVENHGGYSSNGVWLSNVIAATEMDNCGTLPDFGNFCMKWNEGGWSAGCADMYDRYKGMRELMPYAKAVSAKSYRFDERGDEIDIDFMRIMKIVKEAGYTGWIGVEYEGSELPAEEGIKKTIDLLRRTGAEV